MEPTEDELEPVFVTLDYDGGDEDDDWGDWEDDEDDDTWSDDE
jgi:hypothetical protein